MGYALERPGFSVRVDGRFVDRGQWVIHGVVEYRTSMAAARSDVEAEAQIELFLAIARESRSARARGARSIYVCVDGDDEVAGFFRVLDPPSRSGTRHALRS